MEKGSGRVVVQPKKLEFNLEALRGFAAVFVLLEHMVNNVGVIDPSYRPEFLDYLVWPAHLSVLIFFVLSGYVIGVSNKKGLKANQILPYLKKRLMRLYPIYFATIVITLFFVYHKYPFSTILSNLTFLQVLVTPHIAEAGVIWSLHYEVVYYLFFIVISFFNLNPVKVIIAAFALGLVNYFLLPSLEAPLLTSYAFGLVFWCAGLVIAKLPNNKESKANYTLMVASIFLMLGLGNYNLIGTVSATLLKFTVGGPIAFSEQVPWTHRAITFTDLTFLPYCILIVLIFLNLKFRFRSQIIALLFLLPMVKVASVVFLYLKGGSGIDNIQDNLIVFTWTGVSYLVACGLLLAGSKRLESLFGMVIQKGIWLGSISYGLYMVHPLVLLVSKETSFFSGSLTSFLVRIVLVIGVIVLASWLLDKVYQPWARQRMEGLFNFKRKRVPSHEGGRFQEFPKTA